MSLSDTYQYHLDFYLRNGFCTLPVPRPVEGSDRYDGKQPSVPWLPYTKRLPTNDELDEWFTQKVNRSTGEVIDPPNIAIVCGRISNLLVIDVDDLKSALELIKAMPILDDTLTAKTSKGFHIYLRPDVAAGSRTFTLNGLTHHITQEGRFVIAPPSLHKSGRTYEFIDMDTPIVDVVLEELYNTIEQLGGFSQEKDRKVRDIDWASELWGITPEGQRNTRAAQLCGLLIRKFPYDPGFIMGCMKSWNVTACQPPMSKRELENLVEGEISRYGIQIPEAENV